MLAATAISRSCLIEAPAGKLELFYTAPELTPAKIVAIICHPHPLYGGTMHHKVITTTAKACQAAAIMTVTFNFRGVGASTGTYDHGRGEQDDLLAVIEWVKMRSSKAKIILLGFSFGAYIAACVATKLAVLAVVTIAPPVSKFPFVTLQVGCPLIVIQGEHDEIVPIAAVKSWITTLSSPCRFIILPNTSHFFHGKILELQRILMAEITEIVASVR